MGYLFKPVVAHYNYAFVYKTETFIYHYLSNLKSFRPIFMAHEFVNLELFPLEKKDIYIVPSTLPPKWSKSWFHFHSLRLGFGMNVEPEELILRYRNAKLIHAHFGPQGCFALKMRGSMKIPIITNFYGYDLSEPTRFPEWSSRYSDLFRDGDLFLAEGEFMRSKLIEMGAPAEKTKIQRIAIPLGQFPFRTRLPKKSGEKTVILFCGRFVEKKGLIYALQSLERIQRFNKNFEFRIVGDGVLKPQIESFISEHGMGDRVKLLGILDYRSYLLEMQRADIYLHPSVTGEDGNSEGGAPTTILEAQGMGIPVVTTNHADIPNIVVPKGSALLSQEKDIQGLADNIEYLLNNPDLWEEMGSTGRDFVAQYHDLYKELSALEDKYMSLI